MYGPHPAGVRHHYRFYIFLVTLVVGGIFFLLLINNNSDGTGFSLTNAVISTSELAGEEGGIFNLNKGDGTENLIIEQDDNKFQTKLSFNLIPELEVDTVSSEISVTFSDMATPISINGDRLELNGLEEVTLVIDNYAGIIAFNEVAFSLEGKAKKLQVNGLSLTSQEDILITFTNLDYKNVKITDVDFEGITFNKGTGDLSIGEKLSYHLEDEALTIGKFRGDFSFDKTNELLSTLSGEVDGLNMNGELFKLNLE